MKFDPILVVIIILYWVSQCMCAKVIVPPSDQRPTFIVADFFFSKLSDLNPQQDPKTVFDKSYAIFCELVTLSKIFRNSQNLLANNREISKQKIPKNLFDVLISNLNNDGQFNLYPGQSKISFLLKIADYPELIEYLINIQTLMPAEDYVNSFASITDIDKDEFCLWHEFIHYLIKHDSSLFDNNPFFQLINDIEYIFYIPHHRFLSQLKNEVSEMKQFKLQKLLGQEISEQIMYHGSDDTTQLPSTSSSGQQKPDESESQEASIDCSECTVRLEDNSVGIVKNSKKGLVIKGKGGRKCFPVTKKQLHKLKNSSQLVCLNETISQDLDYSTSKPVYRERCFSPGPDQQQTMPSTPSPSGASFLLRFDGIGSQDKDSPVEIKVFPNLPIYACAALASYSIRVKRELSESDQSKVIKDPVLKILTYGTRRSNIVNNEIYNELSREIKVSNNEINSNIADYVEHKIETGDSKTANNVLQKLCKDKEENKSDKIYGYITYKGKSAPLEEESHIKEILDIIYSSIDTS